MQKWIWWATISASRMLIYSITILSIQVFKAYLDERPRLNGQVNNFRNIVDALGLIWFVVGNMWLYGEDSASCKNPEQSPVYKLCTAMIIINYIQICAPCIVAILMIPVFCFCMPCLIRLLARLQGGRQIPRGATLADISSLPIVVIAAEHLSSELQGENNNSCPICLSDLKIGEEGRFLKCKHIFHKTVSLFFPSSFSLSLIQFFFIYN